MWKDGIFDNFITIKRGHDLPERMIVEGEYPVVASTSIKAYHNTYKVEPPCVVTGRSGSLGTVQYINQRCWPLNTTLYAKDYKGNYPKYAYYFLQTLKLENFNSGGAVPTLNQNHLHKLKIKIPPLPIQKNIAAVLSAYDDLIENNNRRIVILEKMAEELYREWFVRLRFPGHEKTKITKGVPEGWYIKRLGEIVSDDNIETGKRPKGGAQKEGIPSIGAENVNGIGQYDFSKEKYVPEEFFNKMKQGILKNKDILFYKDGAEIGRVSLFQDEFPHSHCCINEHVFLIRTDNMTYQYFLYFNLARKCMFEHVQTINKNAAQPGINKTELKSILVLLPQDCVVKLYNAQVEPVIGKLFCLAKTKNSLVTSRDRLLSRLMSGKFDVEALDIQFPASMKE